MDVEDEKRQEVGVTSQCDYFLGQATNRRKFCRVCLCLCTSYKHDSDHRAIIIEIHVGTATKMTSYCKQMARFPIAPLQGPQDKLTTLFKELHLDVEALPLQAQPHNQWISALTWMLIDKRAAPHQQVKLTQQAARLIGRQITVGLKSNHEKFAVVAAEEIEGHLAAGEPKEVWQSLKGRYKAATNCVLRASKMSLAAQTAKRITLYGRVASKGDPLPIHVDKAAILDDIPSDKELRVVTGELQNRYALGATGPQVEHIKVWLLDRVCGEEEQSDIGVGHKWRIFVKLMQAIWEHGRIPKQMRWEILILLPKRAGDNCRIGLLEPFRKVVKKIILS